MLVVMVLVEANEVEVRADARAARMAEVSGLLNVLHAELVDLAGEAVADGVDLHGYSSAAHFVSHRTGSTSARARAVTTIATRRDELPVSVSAFRAGRLSFDQMHAIARRVPASHDAEACELALSATPGQLNRVFARYPWPEGSDAPEPRPEPARPREAAAFFDDDESFVVRARLHPEEGLVVDAALVAHRDALTQSWKDDKRRAEKAGEVFTTPLPTLADALVRMADRSLAAEGADRPHHRRLLAVLHVDVDTPHAQVHLGPAVTPNLRRLLTCDATYRVLYERDGIPIGIGRTSHAIPDRTRLVVEDRDGGCRVPGCERRYVQIHHVHHWEDGGLTDTRNLIALCPVHHRMHHTGGLGIAGTDADTTCGITFTRPDGSVLPGVTPPAPGTRPPAHVEPYRCPEPGRIDPRWLTFHDATS